MLYPKLLLCSCLLLTGATAWPQSEPKKIAEPKAGNGTTEAAEPIPAIARPKLDPLIREQDQMTRLAKSQHPDQQLWLGQGEERFLALYRPALQPVAEGAVLILHARGQHPHWPDSASVLSQALAQHGWTTLALSLPQGLGQTIPERPSSPADTNTEAPSEASGEADAGDSSSAKQPPEKAKQADGNTEPKAPTAASEDNPPPAEPQQQHRPAQDPEPIAQRRLGLAYDYLRQQGLLNLVLLGEGHGALRALEFMNALPQLPPSQEGNRVAGPVAALVLINPQNRRQRATDLDLAKLLEKPGMPVLDIYYDDSSDAKKQAKRRRDYARRAGYQHYRQRSLPPLHSPLAGGENHLSKTVRGFLKRHAKGKAKVLP